MGRKFGPNLIFLNSFKAKVPLTIGEEGTQFGEAFGSWLGGIGWGTFLLKGRNPIKSPFLILLQIPKVPGSKEGIRKLKGRKVWLIGKAL